MRCQKDCINAASHWDGQVGPSLKLEYHTAVQSIWSSWEPRELFFLLHMSSAANADTLEKKDILAPA